MQEVVIDMNTNAQLETARRNMVEAQFRLDAIDDGGREWGKCDVAGHITHLGRCGGVVGQGNHAGDEVGVGGSCHPAKPFRGIVGEL